MTAGWGGNQSVVGTTEQLQEQYLKYIPIPTVPIDECNSTNYFAGALQDDAICGYMSSNQTTCYVSESIQSILLNNFLTGYLFIQFQNDEGAPMMCYSNSNNVWELHGILSYHGNCGRRPQPVIYNSLFGEIKNWIINTIGNSLMFKN